LGIPGAVVSFQKPRWITSTSRSAEKSSRSASHLTVALSHVPQADYVGEGPCVGDELIDHHEGGPDAGDGTGDAEDAFNRVAISHPLAHFIQPEDG